MKLQDYVLSKMCHCEKAAVYGITKLLPTYFVGRGRNLYTVIKAIYKKNSSVDLHVLVSQGVAQGIPEDVSNEIFHYSTCQTDEWENVFEEFKEQAVKRNAKKDAQKIIEDLEVKPIQEVAGFATSKAAEWVSNSEKRYYSGKEIDELDESYGEPILTGYPIYDECIYAHGGNLKGQMKGVICREKHGKTRSECWEVAQNLRQGYNVLYITLEGIKKDITANLQQVLKEQWKELREQVFIVEGYVEITDIASIILENVLLNQVDKVVVDYMQLVLAKGKDENERINTATEKLRNLMVRYNFHLSLLSQSRKEAKFVSVPKDSNGNKLLPNGWKHVPTASDAYGSMALIKAASIVLVGFRPNKYEENVEYSPLTNKVINPLGEKDPFYSFYMQTIRTRYKPEYLHKWWRFNDGDEGLTKPTWI